MLIGHRELFDFRDMLAYIPTDRTAAERAISLETIYPRWLASSRERPRLLPTSIRQKVSAIQALIGLAHAEGWTVNDITRAIPGQRRAVRSYRPFSREELRTLFSLAYFTDNKADRPRTGTVSPVTIRLACFIGLMTGARLEEIAQLHTIDILEKEGVWFIRISEYGPNGEETAKHIKTESSRRFVPIHPRLVDLGLLRYAERQRRADKLWLLSDVRPDAIGRRAPCLRHRIARLINRVSPDPALVFHSFRHGFKDMCRQAGFADSINDQLTGHAPPTVGRAYGDGVDIATLARVVAKLDFNFIDWEPVLRAMSPLVGHD